MQSASLYSCCSQVWRKIAITLTTTFSGVLSAKACSINLPKSLDQLQRHRFMRNYGMDHRRSNAIRGFEKLCQIHNLILSRRSGMVVLHAVI
jgi:hypothetical protein